VNLGVRGFQADGKPDKAVALMKTTRVYPLTKAANPPAMTFVNGSHQEIDTIFSDSGQFFDDLAWMIDYEPHEIIPSHERFQLAAIGIEKGKPFKPNAERRKLLDEAARFGSAIARTNSFASDDEARIVYPDRKWEWAFIGSSASWDSQGYVNTDRRASFAYIAIGMSPAMVEKHIGTGRNISGLRGMPVPHSSTAATTIGCGFRQTSRSRISGQLWPMTLIAVRFYATISRSRR
jgi:hypothetical protein